VARTNNIQKLTYSGEARSSLASTLTIAAYGIGGTQNRGVCAYMLSGQGQAAPYYTGLLQKLTFSTDTAAVVSYNRLNANLTNSNYCPTYDGQMCLVYSGFNVSTAHFISAFYFSTETQYITSAQLTYPNPQNFGNLEDSGAY
jgi:hypothetical protein